MPNLELKYVNTLYQKTKSKRQSLEDFWEKRSLEKEIYPKTHRNTSVLESVFFFLLFIYLFKWPGTYQKETLAFSREFCEIFKNTYFAEIYEQMHLETRLLQVSPLVNFGHVMTFSSLEHYYCEINGKSCKVICRTSKSFF